MKQIKMPNIHIDTDNEGNYILLINHCPILTTSNPEYIHAELKNQVSYKLAQQWTA